MPRLSFHLAHKTPAGGIAATATPVPVTKGARAAQSAHYVVAASRALGVTL